MDISAQDLFSPSKLREFGSDYVKLLTVFLKKANKSSTGALLNSIAFKLRPEAENISIIIESNDYLTYVDKGRRPGSFPPIQAISRWASVRGIPQTAVFPIARSIFKFGIEPTNVIQKTISELEGPSFVRRYEEEVAINLEQIILKSIEEINK
jgi:hypothetical protein